MYSCLQIEAKKAVPKENSRRGGSHGVRTRKVFLGGLDPATTKEDIKETFMDIGTLTDIQIMTEKGTEKPRGFGFVSFEDYETVENVCSIKHFKIRVCFKCCIIGLLKDCFSLVSSRLVPPDCLPCDEFLICVSYTVVMAMPCC